MQIVVQQAQTVNLDSIVVEYVRDIFTEYKIVAKIKNLPRPIILWKGFTEYTSASAWNNQTAAVRASEVLTLSSIPWEF